VRNGEVNALVPERIWRETERALGETNPEVFFDTLERCEALSVLFPELPWSDTERSALLRSAQLSGEAAVRFAALSAGVAPKDILSWCDRLRIPTQYRELARLTASVTTRLDAGLGSSPADTLLALFEQADAFRRRERFEKVLIAACARTSVDPQILTALSAATQVALSPEQMKALKGFEIARLLHDARLERLRDIYRS